MDDVRGTLAHDDRVRQELSKTIEQVQNRRLTEGDTIWIRERQDALGRGDTTQADIRKDLARWTAHNCHYDQIYRDNHGRDPTFLDQKYAGDMIGNGWSVQDYRRNEAYSSDAREQLSKLYSRTLGREANDQEIADRQKALADGRSLAGQRHDMAFSPEATNRLTQQTSDMIRKAGINQSAIWPGIPEALNGLQGTIAAGQATMRQIETAVQRCMFSTCFSESD